MLYLPPWSLTSTVDDSVKIQLKSTKCNSSFIHSSLRPSFVRDFGLNTGSQLINICKCYQPNDFAKRVIYQVLLNWYCSPCLVDRLNSSPIIFCLLTTTFSSLFRVVMFFTHCIAVESLWCHSACQGYIPNVPIETVTSINLIASTLSNVDFAVTCTKLPKCGICPTLYLGHRKSRDSFLDYLIWPLTDLSLNQFVYLV